jgi:hypothetical protein
MKMVMGPHSQAHQNTFFQGLRQAVYFTLMLHKAHDGVVMRLPKACCFSSLL